MERAPEGEDGCALLTKAQANGRYLRAAGTAANSQQLDGLDSTAFLPVAGKAADAELLDGIDSSQLMRGNGQALDGANAIPGGENGTNCWVQAQALFTRP